MERIIHVHIEEEEKTGPEYYCSVRYRRSKKGKEIYLNFWIQDLVGLGNAIRSEVKNFPKPDEKPTWHFEISPNPGHYATYSRKVVIYDLGRVSATDYSHRVMITEGDRRRVALLGCDLILGLLRFMDIPNCNSSNGLVEFC
jgi:hypothetical protein